MSGIFETIMLVCFGLSWPINVVKAYKAKSTKGMSLPFILLIIFGYICGISAKIVSKQFNYVFVVYIINLVIVLLNVVVYIRNRRLENKKSNDNESRKGEGNHNGKRSYKIS